MFRKVTRTGPSTLTIALPAKWAKNHNLKPSSFVELKETETSLVIIPTSQTSDKSQNYAKITYNELLIEDMLEKLFLEAESTIIVESESEIPKSINKVISKFPGFNIIDIQPKKIIIDRTLTPTLNKPEAMIRRCYVIIKESLHENPPKFPEDLNDLLFILQLHQVQEKEIFILREILNTLAKIKTPVHDDAYSLLKMFFVMLHKQKYNFSNAEAEKINHIIEKINEMFAVYFKSRNSPIELSELYHGAQMMAQLHKEIVRQQSIHVLGEKEERQKIKKFRVGVCLKNQSNKFWAQDVKSNMEETASEYKDTEYVFDSPLTDFDISSQEKILNKFISEKLDGIILAPVEPKKLDKIIEKVNKLNIPLLILDTDLELPNRKYTFIGFNNYKGGQLTANNLKKYLNKKSEILVIEGHSEGNFSQRAEGFINEIEKIHNIRFVRGEFQESVAYKKTLNYMKKHKVDAIFATSDNMATGAIKAAEQLNKKALVCGFDRTEDGMQAMNEGKLLSDVDTKPKEMGILAIQTMNSLLNKKTVADRIEYNIEIVTKTDK
jgi:ribose transport system substrate-binding protein